MCDFDASKSVEQTDARQKENRAKIEHRRVQRVATCCASERTSMCVIDVGSGLETGLMGTLGLPRASVTLSHPVCHGSRPHISAGSTCQGRRWDMKWCMYTLNWYQKQCDIIVSHSVRAV